MAILKGNAASLKVSTNTVAECSSWQLEIGQEYVDTTSFGDTAREQTPTFLTWSGSATGKWDITDTNGQLALQTAILAGSTVEARFYVSSALYYKGTAYVSASMGAAVDGIVEISYEFTAAGALSYH